MTRYSVNNRGAKTTSYLSHTSAALYWKIPYLHVVLGYPSKEAMLDSQRKDQRCFFRQELRKKDGAKMNYLRSLPLPKRAFCADNNGDLVASPELVFLDLARQLDFHRRVLLGLQLCSSAPDGRKPLTTPFKLMSFLKACKGHSGVRPAVQATGYVTGNSWSIMESLLYMTLTLPYKYGGYGLTGAKLNQDIYLKEKGDWQKSNRLTADLYWEQAKLVVEYDSYEYHNTANRWVKDARRITTLERNGYKTLSINSAQMYNDSALTEAAHVIARHLGKRIHIRTSSFAEQRQILCSLLPRVAIS